MLWRQILEAFDLLDCPRARAQRRTTLHAAGLIDVINMRVQGDTGATDFVRAHIPPGLRDKDARLEASTLAMRGPSQYVGAQPERDRLCVPMETVRLAAIAFALKLGAMARGLRVG